MNTSYIGKVNTAVELCIETDTYSGLSYLTPLYKEVLRENDIMLPNDINYEELREILELEVKKRNAIFDKIHPVAEWLYNVILDNAQPMMESAESDLVNQFLQYMQQSVPKKEDAEANKEETEE